MSRKCLLILMRHAKSDWPEDAASDADRPLAPRGEKDAPRMGKWLRKSGLIPDKLISSPARRARDTAELVAGKLRIRKRRIVIDDRIYGTGVRRLLEVVSDHGKDSETLLLVGHNPGLEELLLYLVPAPVPRDETGKLMTAGAVAVLEFEESIAGKRHGAKLVKLVRPRDLKKKKPDEAPE